MIYHDGDITDGLQRDMYDVHSDAFRTLVSTLGLIAEKHSGGPVEDRLLAQVLALTAIEFAATVVSGNLESLLHESIHGEYVNDMIKMFVVDLRDKCGDDVVDAAIALRRDELLADVEPKGEA